MSGIDRNDPAAEQLQVLKDILKELKIISGKPSGSLLGGLPLSPPVPPGPKTGPGPKTKPGPKTGPKTNRVGNLGRFARAGRFLGPVGLGLTAGMAIYDGVKGFNADEGATLGQRFQNAGRNVGSGLTFGLMDSVEEKMADGSYQADREAENTQQSLQETANRAGENGPQQQQRQAIIDRRNAVPVESTATPVATTPGFVTGTATPAVTTPTVLPRIDGPAPPPFVVPKGFEPLIDGNGKIITELGLSNSPSSVTQSPSVTSNAIQNMTNLSTSSTQSAPTIINNITNNNTSASSAAPQILTMPSTPRNNSNLIQRFQDKTFAGI